MLYDDSCGFCRRWVPFWRGTLERRGYSIAPLQSEWVRERLGLSGDELAEDLRLLFPDGRVTRGADVYRDVYAANLVGLPAVSAFDGPGAAVPVRSGIPGVREKPPPLFPGLRISVRARARSFPAAEPCRPERSSSSRSSRVPWERRISSTARNRRRSRPCSPARGCASIRMCSRGRSSCASSGPCLMAVPFFFEN